MGLVSPKPAKTSVFNFRPDPQIPFEPAGAVVDADWDEWCDYLDGNIIPFKQHNADHANVELQQEAEVTQLRVCPFSVEGG